MYIVLVGPSATGKGTAMSPALDIINEVPAIRTAAQATSLQALIRRLKETNLTDIDIETGGTQFHSSMTIFSKEFTVFLGYHNRELMAALCDWYDCDRRWKYETISRKTEEIIGVWVNLIGGTTPDLVQSSLPIESIGGGLTSRIIFVYEQKRAKLVALPNKTAEEEELQKDLIHDLEKISLLSGEFTWTNEFSSAWQRWCEECDQHPPFSNPKFDGYMGRRRGHVMKLAMIINAAHGQRPMKLDAQDLIVAIKLIKEVETKMPLVFRGVGSSDTASLMQKMMVFVENSQVDTIPMFQVARYFENDMDKLMLDRILKTVELMKRIKIINVPSGDSYIKILPKES